MRTLAVLLALAALAGGSWYLARRWQVAPLPYKETALLPTTTARDGKLQVRIRGGERLADISSYQDEFFAYLMFEHFRHTTALRETELLLTYHPNRSAPYHVLALVENPADLAEWHWRRLAPVVDWRTVSGRELNRLRQQTRLFVGAYNLPVRRTLEQISRDRLLRFVRRFIRFKSNIDPRIRKQIEPVPTPLNQEEAQRLAGDIITVAEFYQLPLEFFLGIGAMENNYMNVRGDLGNTIWKRRPAKDDVVLERRRGRVRVLNESAGVWQITQETLRYAHKLYLGDTRDYTKLPEHLIPPQELKVREVDPDVLTTYAGLLFRDLLDRFQGDVPLAVGAYNGGPGNPNPKYESGVRLVASHARRLLERAAALHGESVLEQRWWTAK